MREAGTGRKVGRRVQKGRKGSRKGGKRNGECVIREGMRYGKSENLG